MKRPPYTHDQLIKEANFSDDDLEQIKQRRREHNRLGFAYQLAFVRLFNRFPKAGNQPDQQDFERDEEILSYVSIQLGLPSQIIDDALLSKDQRSHSSLYRLKKTPNRPSPGALLRLARKLEQIGETGILSIDLFPLATPPGYDRRDGRYVRQTDQ